MSYVLRDRIGLEVAIVSMLRQNRLRWYGHVLRKDDGDWVERCLDYEVEDSVPRSRLKKTWTAVLDSDLKCFHLHACHALDCNKWSKLISGKQSHSDAESGDRYFRLI